jgi:hypothetical protein
LGTTPALERFAAFALAIFNLISPEVFDRQSGKQVYSSLLRL